MKCFTAAALAALAAPATADGLAFTTSFIPLTERPVHLVPVDANSDGRDDLVVAYASPVRYQLWFADTEGRLSPGPTSFLSAQTATRPVVGDINQDGRPDLVVPSPAEAQVNILLGDGTGSFLEAANSPLPSVDNLQAVAVVDLDQDGDQDIVAGGDRALAIYHNENAGSFGVPTIVPTAYPTVTDVAAGNIRGLDGVEIALLAPGAVAIYDNDSGSYADPQIVLTNGSGNGARLFVGDGDNNGVDDLIVPVVNRVGAMLFRVNSGGLFTVVNIPPGTPSVSYNGVAMGDINADGRPDLVFGPGNTATNRILYNTAGTGIPFTATEPPFGAFDDLQLPAVLDTDGDGLFEVVYASTDNWGLMPIRQDDFNTFRGVGFYETLNSSSNRILRLPDRDGDPSFLVNYASTNNEVVSLTLRPDIVGFQAEIASLPGLFGSNNSPVLVDLNNDGILDVAQLSSSSSIYRIRWQLGQPDGSFGVALNRSIGDGNASNLTQGDFNNDGVVDLAVLTSLGDARVCLTDPNGSLGPATPVPLSPTTGPASLVAADFDLDGNLDLLCSNRSSSGRIHVAFGRGDGTFEPPATFEGPPSAGATIDNWAATGDLNDDGRHDLLIAGNSAVYVVYAGPSRAFEPPTTLASTSGLTAVRISDLDGDGRNEAVAAVRNQALVFGRSASGQLETKTSFYHSGSVSDFLLEDVDADGRKDFVYLVSLGFSVIYNRSALSCPADYFPDGRVDLFDIAQFIRDFNDAQPAADFNNDQRVDFFDVAAFIQAFNAGCP